MIQDTLDDELLEKINSIMKYVKDGSFKIKKKKKSQSENITVNTQIPLKIEKNIKNNEIQKEVFQIKQDVNQTNKLEEDEEFFYYNIYYII